MSTLSIGSRAASRTAGASGIHRTSVDTRLTELRRVPSAPLVRMTAVKMPPSSTVAALPMSRASGRSVSDARTPIRFTSQPVPSSWSSSETAATTP
jgi:hypothetical protein